jgi:hypothetical protein
MNRVEGSIYFKKKCGGADSNCHALLQALPPQGSASTNFATAAKNLYKQKKTPKSVFNFVPRNGIFFIILNELKNSQNKLKANYTKLLTQFQQK